MSLNNNNQPKILRSEMNLFAILTWGMLIALSFSSHTAMNKMTIAPGLASFSLTCPELATLNTKLDSLIRYTFPAEVPGHKAYAVQDSHTRINS